MLLFSDCTIGKHTFRMPLPAICHSKSIQKILWAMCAAIGLGLQGVAQSDPGQIAFSLEREGKLAEAEKAWAALAKQFPTKAEPLAHLGLIESKEER